MSRSNQLLIRLMDEEKEAFSNAAMAAGLSASGWIRSRLRTAAIAELKAVDIQVAFLLPVDKKVQPEVHNVPQECSTDAPEAPAVPVAEPEPLRIARPFEG